MFDRSTVLQNLKENGYAVLPSVLSVEDCDIYIKEFKDWVKQVEDSGKSFRTVKSLLQSYRIGHFNACWRVRLAVKDIFAQIWSTDKLLTSVDAVALSYPPEEGSNAFAKPDENWLHIDQGIDRIGVHAYQGAVYLEEASASDHCFRVLAKSHDQHETFFKNFPSVGPKTRENEFHPLNELERKWYIEEMKCKLTKVEVPKGGMVLWDSRTVHDNSRPEFGRPNGSRWRHVVFVSMTPALWTTPRDINRKRDAYENLLMTTHWSSNGVKTLAPFN